MSFHRLTASEAFELSENSKTSKLEEVLALIEAVAKSGKRRCQVAYNPENKEHRDALYEIREELGYTVKASTAYSECLIVSW